MSYFGKIIIRGKTFSHSFKETYLYINLVKVSIAIGVMMGKDKRIEIEL